MWGANTFPLRNSFSYPISGSQDRVLSLLGFRDAFTFLLLRDKKRSMATSLIQLSDDVQPVVSAGDFTGDRTDLCWSDQESILAFIFHVYWVFIYLFIYLLALL